MRTITVWLIVFLAAGNSFAQENLRPDVPVALVGGMLLDGYEAEPIHHSVVIFENGLITAVGSKHDTEIPANAVIIDTGPLQTWHAIRVQPGIEIYACYRSSVNIF